MDKKVELKIAGMTCAMCAKGIEASLSRLPGVLQAQVNLGTETAYIEYNPTKVKLAELAKVIADLGYQTINMYIPIKIPFSISYLMLIISTPAFVYISHPIFKAAYRALKNENHLSPGTGWAGHELGDGGKLISIVKKICAPGEKEC